MPMQREVNAQPRLQLWAGLECTLNRIGDEQRDQLAFTGHYDRPDDIDRLAAFGVRTVRYPILWERLADRSDDDARWIWHDARLARMHALGLEPILGLVHHGCGPLNTHLLDDGFADGLATFASTVAKRYPWVSRFTPVNEPLTTARFSTLYGLWYPHIRDDASCLRAMLNQIRATRLSMEAIRGITPRAELVQTEDLGKTHSTAALQYQADFENVRRWLTFDLLTGRIVPGHRMYDHMRSLGISDAEIARAVGDGCAPDIVGINHYVTSERWLDERLDAYPPSSHGGNGRQRYADVEAVRARREGVEGPRALLKEAWERYRLPVAATEVHLGCTREHQMRWLEEVWDAALALREEGADIRAITTWAVFGTQDWSSLLTRLDGHYESGLFDVRSVPPRPTALASMARGFATGKEYDHPALDEPGWWRRADRITLGPNRVRGSANTRRNVSTWSFPRTILVCGASGTLGTAFDRVCAERGLSVRAVHRRDMDIADRDGVERMLHETRAWAIINAAGYVRVDDAETDRAKCRRENVVGATTLAEACARHGIRYVAFSSDLVFDGRKTTPYFERDSTSPVNWYGVTKANAEQRLRAVLPDALIVRTAAFFGLWDSANFLTRTLEALCRGTPQRAADDLVISPTFVPDLVHATLDLLIDGERGIWHLTNEGAVSWAELARRAATLAGLDAALVQGVSYRAYGFVAKRPAYSALASERGAIMPSLDNALDRYVQARPWEHLAAELRAGAREARARAG
jgi:dTDP-4-dehydrorhamnose reductase